MNQVTMTAPSGGNYQKREKRTDIQLVPFGLHPVILYSVVDLGTQQDEFPRGSGNITSGHKIRFTFEFPLHKQFFYVDDTEQRPSVLSMEFAFAIYKNSKTGKKTKLLDFIESVVGILRPEDYDRFDVSSLLGHMYTANVQHSLSGTGKTSAKITGISPFQTQFYQNELQSGALNRTNPLVLFSMAHGFESAAFASMSFFDRKQVKTSAEAVAHAQRGGKFSKFDDKNNLVWDDAPMPSNAPTTTGQMYQQAQQQHNQQAPQQGYQQAPATQAGPNYQNNQAPQQGYTQPQGQPQAGYQPQGQPVQQAPQQAYNQPQQAPQQGAPTGPGNVGAGGPTQGFNQPQNQGAPAMAQQPVQQGMNPQQQPGFGQPAGTSNQGFYQPNQNGQAMNQPEQPMQPVQQSQQAVSPAQQFMQGPPQQQQAPAVQPMQQGQPMQQQQPVQQQMFQQPPAGANTGATVFDQNGPVGFREEDHDDLPF